MKITIDKTGLHYDPLSEKEEEELMRKLWEAVKAYEKERE
jgi:hypothetical protein